LLRLAYSNLKPENVLVDKQDCIKIADFDYTNFISLEFEVYILLYRQLLGSKAGLKEGTAGKLGTCTEQFAFGSLFYYINYRIEVYNNQDFDKDYRPVIVKQLQ
jgi:serine/threonine protein kinase